MLAAFGTQALLTAAPETRKTPLWWWLGGAGVAVLMAFAGAFQGIMRSLADPQRIGAVTANYPAFQADTVRVLVLIVAAAALCNVALSRAASAEPGGVFWWVTSRAARPVERRAPLHPVQPAGPESFAPDSIVRTLQADSGVYRVLSINEYQGLENYMMSQRVRAVLGYHGNELQRYDELLGGKNEWAQHRKPQPAETPGRAVRDHQRAGPDDALDRGGERTAR